MRCDQKLARIFLLCKNRELQSEVHLTGAKIKLEYVSISSNNPFLSAPELHGSLGLLVHMLLHLADTVSVNRVESMATIQRPKSSLPVKETTRKACKSQVFDSILYSTRTRQNL